MGFFDRRPPNGFKLQPPPFYFGEGPTSSLIGAALIGDVDGARRAVADGADPNASGLMPGGGGFSPLHYALAADNETAVRVLGVMGADPERRVPGMGMPFLFAVTLNNERLLSSLLDLKPVDRLQEETRRHLLFESARRSAPGCLVSLVDRGVAIDLKDAAGYTLMLRSIEMNELDLTLWLLERGAAVDFVTLGGVTPAYSIEYELNTRTPPGGPKEAQVREIIRIMTERGARFPALTPQQERSRVGR